MLVMSKVSNHQVLHYSIDAVNLHHIKSHNQERKGNHLAATFSLGFDLANIKKIKLPI